MPDELNPPQAEAVGHVNGPLLVFAGAGSGKTRVITYRVANLVAEARVPPYRILAVTFTNKAAGEMRARLVRLLGEELAKELWVGTFHATCARLLRRNGAAVGVPSNFVIYDAQDQRTLVTRAIKELDLDDKRYPPRKLLAAIQKEKQEGRDPESMKGVGVGYMDDKVRQVFERYEAQLAAAGAVDFDDLIGKTRRLLLPEDSKLRSKFWHVLVDEFQDTNWLQYELVRLLSSSTRNLCVVGDDDQSIYKWRGADRRNILGFHRDYPDAKIVKLEQNYRSTSRIVTAALGVIAPSTERVPKSLWTENDAGVALDVVAVRDEHEEAALVVQTLKEARESGQALRELAVFYRVHAQSRVLEEQLRAAKIPYQIVGGTKFFERAEIKDALSYLRVLVNDRSDVDLLRVINTPPRGIGQATVDRLTALATAKHVSLYEALAKPEESADLGGAPLRKLRAVRELLVGIKSATASMTPSDALLHVLDTTGYLVALQEDTSPESASRLENLRELVGFDPRLRGRSHGRRRRSVARRVPRARHAAHRRRRHRGRGRLGHAHDRPCRQGSRVRWRHHHGHGGGHVPLPQHARRQARRHRRRTTPCLRRHHPRTRAAHVDPCPHASDLRHFALGPAEPLPLGHSGRRRRSPGDARSDHGLDAFLRESRAPCAASRCIS